MAYYGPAENAVLSDVVTDTGAHGPEPPHRCGHDQHVAIKQHFQMQGEAEYRHWFLKVDNGCLLCPQGGGRGGGRAQGGIYDCW